ncbi:MAG: hypothetical protein ACLR0N_10495 [Bilophila wadsworthia]
MFETHKRTRRRAYFRVAGRWSRAVKRLRSDSDSEDDTIFVYNELRKVCVDNGDILTAKLFETIIGEEQIHLNYFDNISDHIETLGDTFLSKIAGTPSSTGGTTKGFAIAPAAAN